MASPARREAARAPLVAPARTKAREPPAAPRSCKTANAVIATSGLRTSLQQIADAAGILAGSLYHHFESKEAILVELIRRYHADLDRIGEAALERLDEPDPRPADEQITGLGRAIARCAVEHRAALQMSFYEGPSTDPELIELTHRRPTKITGRDAAGFARGPMERVHPDGRRSAHRRRPDGARACCTSDLT